MLKVCSNDKMITIHRLSFDQRQCSTNGLISAHIVCVGNYSKTSKRISVAFQYSCWLQFFFYQPQIGPPGRVWSRYVETTKNGIYNPSSHQSDCSALCNARYTLSMVQSVISELFQDGTAGLIGGASVLLLQQNHWVQPLLEIRVSSIFADHIHNVCMQTKRNCNKVRKLDLIKV